MLLMALVINPLIIFIYLHRNPYLLVLRCLRRERLAAFFTRKVPRPTSRSYVSVRSSAWDKDIYSVSIPLGATISMDGAAIPPSRSRRWLRPTRWAWRSAVPAAILLSIMSALARAVPRRCGRLAAAHPDGLLAVRHLQ